MSGSRAPRAPRRLPALRSGATLGLPLLAPWANRLGSRRYRAAGVDVDLNGLPLGTDANGLPMHGLLVGKPGWRLDRRSGSRGRAGFRASIDVDAPAFPFPHRIEVFVVAREHQLALDTTVIPTGSRPVPVAFGWHPYLRLPGTPRRQWQRARTTAGLAPISPRPPRPPTGGAQPSRGAEPIEAADLRRPVSPRPQRRLVGGRRRSRSRSAADRVSRPGVVPAGRPFAALEPMAAATNGLVDGTTPLVEPGEAFTASFTLSVGEPP
jgi:galactose mutarotase-like enzyme